MIKGVLLDLSGTIYIGNEPVPRAVEAVERLHAQKIPLQYLTNSSRVSRQQILDRLQSMGLAVTGDEIFTAPQAIRAYLQEHHLSPWLLVHQNLEAEFADLVDGPPDAVVLCDAADGFSYAALNRAFQLLQGGARLLAVGDNRYFREGEEMSLDAGPFVRALEYAAGAEAIILGKPSPAFFHAAISQLGCRPGEVLMVGDDVFTDVNGALKAGLKAALVQTGKYRSGDELEISAPGACVCKDVYDAVSGLF